MIRIKPIKHKAHKSALKKKVNSDNEQNIKPKQFNTRGYFDPAEPNNSQYRKVREEVFLRYRQPEEGIVMLDIKNTTRGAFIQRGIPTGKLSNIEPSSCKTSRIEPSSCNLLKHYLFRKERKEQIDHEKFLQLPKVNADSHLRLASMTARTVVSRQISSRISTASVLKVQSQF